MSELLRAIRLVGLPHMMKLRRGYRTGWQEMLSGYVSTHALFALLNVGFVDEMLEKGVVDPATFASKNDLDGQVLASTCAALYHVGLFDRTDGGYTFSEKGRTILQTLRGWIELTYGYDEVFVNLEDLLRKKRTYGEDMYRRPDYVARGSGEMEDLLFFPLAIDEVKTAQYGHVLDLGCGDGTFLRKMCSRLPGVNGTGIDLAPLAVEQGNQKAAQEGLSGRVTLFAEDISKIQNAAGRLKGIEAATVFFVLHELLYDGEERVLDFLRDYRRLFPKAPLMVFEAIRPSDDAMRKRPGVSIFYHYFHELSRQRPTTREKWRELFAKAGFENVTERFLNFAATSVFTVR